MQLVLAHSAMAQDGIDQGEIIVTGTRDAQRTAFDALAPVDVLDADNLQSVVSADVADKLARELPSFNVQRLPAADGLAFVRPATLRGLSPDQTLVMVNSKRYHRSALLGSRGSQAPDLNTFPGFAVSRVEVLRDGAVAQYGSDAIAGVINFILEDKPGFDAYAQAGQYYAGDGEKLQAGLRAGVALGDAGAIVATIEYADNSATSRTRQRPDAIELAEARPDLDIPDPVQRWGQPDNTTLRGSLNAHYTVEDAVELYAFATFADGDGQTDFNWRNPATTGSVYKDSAAFPGFNFDQIFPAGFTPRFGTEFDDYQIAGGVRGDMSADLSYDLSVSGGRSRINYTLDETVNASLGSASPTSFYLGRLGQRELNINADFVYGLDLGGMSALNIAFGAERREETYSVRAGDPASYAIGAGAPEGLAPNSNGFPGFSDIQAGEWSQESYAGYFDLEYSPLDVLTLGAAARYEDYSEFGDTFNYKLSARVEPMPGLALRAAWSTGFRAPTPGQLNTSSTSQGLDTVSLQIFTRGRLSPDNPISVALGAKPLTPEESENLSAGVAFKRGGFKATLDLYQVKVFGRFGQSASFAVPDALPNPLRFTTVSYYTNDFDTRTRGIDAVVAWRGDIGPGLLEASLAYNYNETAVIGATSATIGNDTQRRIFEERLPKHNAVAALGFDAGIISTNLHARYYGAWTDSTGNSTGDIFQRFGGIVLFDASLTANLHEAVDLTLGAENLFDTYPDEATFQANRGLIYSRNAPYDTDGGLYYLRVGIHF
ncbi:TonB-dependent receptor [Aurantiacibacter sp. DGU5]|uniref:TonB-dependent receptor n=2 Tax=Aurantiacibacter flavus TaxID=3145232 RepID=A0ABV0CUQ0_9SPHN